jgi:hypothetical protein
MAESYKISDEFHERLERMSADDQVSVVVLASEPAGLEEALADESVHNSLDRRKIVYPLNEQAMAPIMEYFGERGVNYDTNVVMRSVFANPTVEQVRELAKQDYVQAIMENQRV